MRRLFGWLAGLAGVAALAKLLHRRRREPPAGAPLTDEPDPAAELRRKLDEVRAGEAAPAGAAGEEPTTTGSVGAAQTAPERTTDEDRGLSIEERRAAIHAKAQEAIDAMRGDEQ